MSDSMDTASLDSPYILRRKPAADGHGNIVLAYTGRTNVQPWVTWWEAPNGEERQYGMGHYYEMYGYAVDDFEKREG